MLKLFLISTLLILAYYSKGQAGLFDDHNLVKIDIVTDLRNLFSDTNPETAKYHKGLLTYIDTNGASVSISVRLKTRGIFRRSRENCNLPPLTVNFKDDSLSNHYFNDIKKIKLVNVCNRKRESFEQYLVREYLVYRIYNLFTEYSFRVRFVKILYVDINNALPPFESVGFFIEEMKSLNTRTNTKPIKTLGIIQEAVDRSHMDMTAIFQYMIGNTDWSVPKLHNIKLVVKDSLLIPIAIPYDFDFCGFVNPPYTKPPEIIPIKNVTERYFRGFCRTKEELDPVINQFKAQKENVFKLIQEDTLLNIKSKKQLVKYITEFYEIIENPRYLNREFIDNCRKN